MNRTALILSLTASLPLVGCGADDAELAVYASSADPGTGAGAGPSRFRLPDGYEARTALTTAKVGPGELATELLLHGTVRFDGDRHATVVARQDGRIDEVHVELGASVEKGQLLAVLESRALARARSAYVEASHRVEFAERRP